MKKIEAKIVADSVNEYGNRIITYALTYPRFIHAEVMTHRVFSRNTASSRAIPLKKMIKMVQDDPFIPIAWQKDHKGMQGTEYFTQPLEIESCELEWLNAANDAVKHAKKLNYNGGVTKQLCNRLLEPFMWHTALVTATEYANFFNLRCPYIVGDVDDYDPKARFFSTRDVVRKSCLAGMPSDFYSRFEFVDWQKFNLSGAEIHIQALAESMWDARNASTPKKLDSGEWHIPFGDKIVDTVACDTEETRIKIATARCARISYMTFDGEIDYEKDIALYDMLLSSKHLSPFEHCAQAMGEKDLDNNLVVEDGLTTIGASRNFAGFKQYRQIIENE